MMPFSTPVYDFGRSTNARAKGRLLERTAPGPCAITLATQPSSFRWEPSPESILYLPTIADR